MTTPVKPVKRRQVLEAQQRLKMARSAHAYVRGSTVKFYELLNAQPGDSIPSGPPVWICGDCHLGNLGPVADVKGRVEIAIRDLDQAVIGNPAHDLIRLGLSLAIAARGSDLPGVTTALVLEQMMEGYETSLSHPNREYSDFERIPGSIRRVLRQAIRRDWKHLAKERIEDIEPAIPLGRNFWSLSSKEKKAIGRLFDTDEIRGLVTSLKSRENDAKMEVVDAAYWMKGCSSLGRLRYAVLVRVGKAGSRDAELCLIDIKEAIGAAAPRSNRSRMPRNNAMRVVAGANALSPFLGQRMVAASLLQREVFVRELLPQDLKLEFERITTEEATAAASYLAGVVGKAHGRQMEISERQAWRAELARHRTKALDAPSWLWRSVVQLVASHESAYLEHCLAYARLGQALSE